MEEENDMAEEELQALREAREQDPGEDSAAIDEEMASRQHEDLVDQLASASFLDKHNKTYVPVSCIPVQKTTGGRDLSKL